MEDNEDDEELPQVPAELSRKLGGTDTDIDVETNLRQQSKYQRLDSPGNSRTSSQLTDSVDSIELKTGQYLEGEKQRQERLEKQSGIKV